MQLNKYNKKIPRIYSMNLEQCHRKNLDKKLRKTKISDSE